MKLPGETFSVTLQAESGDDRPTDIRLRQFLKSARRQFGFRCVRLQRVANGVNPVLTDGTEGEALHPPTDS
jgi:hypothetical protein